MKISIKFGIKKLLRQDLGLSQKGTVEQQKVVESSIVLGQIPAYLLPNCVFRVHKLTSLDSATSCKNMRESDHILIEVSSSSYPLLKLFLLRRCYWVNQKSVQLKFQLSKNQLVNQLKKKPPRIGEYLIDKTV